MSVIEPQVVDSTARVVLPPRFAGASVVVQEVSAIEVRIRKMTGDADADVVFVEESITVLSDRDRDRFLELLENPPPPTPALIEAFKKRIKHDG